MRSADRWPMLFSFLPIEMPGVLASTMKPVNAWPALAFLLHSAINQCIRCTRANSVLASTKNQLAWPAPVIHILEPLITQSLPFLTADVYTALSKDIRPGGSLTCTPATSEPAPGSVTQYAAISGCSHMLMNL